MKFRLTLGLLALFAGLAIGFSALPAQAHAATTVALTDTDRSSLQSVLDLTKATLDTIQLQINRKAIQNPPATLAVLKGIEASLYSMRELLGGAPAPVSMLIEEPEPLAFVPRTPRPVAVAPAAPAAPEAPVVAEAPPGEVAGEALVNEPAPEQQTASASGSETSKRAFWIILIAAIVIAIILAIPRKKTLVLQGADSAPQAPPEPHSEEHEPVQSA